MAYFFALGQELRHKRGLHLRVKRTPTVNGSVYFLWLVGDEDEDENDNDPTGGQKRAESATVTGRG